MQVTDLIYHHALACIFCDLMICCNKLRIILEQRKEFIAYVKLLIDISKFSGIIYLEKIDTRGVL